MNTANNLNTLCVQNTTKIGVLESNVIDIKEDVAQIRADNKEISNDMKALRVALENFINATTTKVGEIDSIKSSVNDLKSFKTNIIFSCCFISACIGVASNVVQIYHGG